MVVENLTSVIVPIADTTNNVILNISYAVGGLFGLTVIMFLYKIYKFRQFDKKIDHINSELIYIKNKISKK